MSQNVTFGYAGLSMITVMEIKRLIVTLEFIETTTVHLIYSKQGATNQKISRRYFVKRNAGIHRIRHHFKIHKNRSTPQNL